MAKFLGLGLNDTQIKKPEVGAGVGNYGGWEGGAARQKDLYDQEAGKADGRQGAQINQGQFNKDRDLEMGARGMQGQAYGQLQGLANGTGPSLAAAQGKVMQTNAINSMASGAAGATGGGAGLASARRASMLGGAQAQGNIAGQTMMARQAEQVGAINSMSGAAGAMRSGDAARAGQSGSMATNQAQIQQQQNSLNDQRNMGYAGLGNDVMKTDAQLQMEKAKLESANQLAQQQQEMQKSKDMQAANAANAGLLGGVTNSIGGALGKLSDERTKTDIQSFDQKKNDAGYGGTPGDMIPDSPDQARAETMMHSGHGGPAGMQWGASNPMGDEANAKIFAAKKYYGGSGEEYGKIAYGDNAVYSNNAGGMSSLQGGKVGSEAGGSSEGSGWKLSDGKKKQDVASAPAPTVEMARNLNGVTYKYKPEVVAAGHAEPGREYGVIAQDLEKSEMGKSLVDETPAGKQINVPKATGALLATVAEQQKQIDAMTTGAAEGGTRPDLIRRRDAEDAGEMKSLRNAALTAAAPLGKPAGAAVISATDAMRESPEIRGVANAGLRGLGSDKRVRAKGESQPERAAEEERMQAQTRRRMEEEKAIGYKTSMTDAERKAMFDKDRSLAGLRGKK